MAFEDITKEKKLKEELKKNEREYKQIFDSMYDIFQVIELVYDENGNAIDYYYLQVNPAFEKLVNKTKSELVGKRAKSIFGIVEDHWMKTYERVDKTGKFESYVNYGAELDKYYRINAWKADTRKVAIAFRDITKQKRIEQELIAAKDRAEESDRLKSAFLANMGHEIRTPMNGILGFANLLKNANLTGEKQQDYIKIIEKSGMRMLNIINDIITISKIEGKMMEPNIVKTNINEHMEYIYALFSSEVEAKGLQFSYKNSLSSKESIIQTDQEKLFTIFKNLIKNSIKYTEEGSIEFGYIKKGEFLEFYVKDTGLGIDSDRLSAIFERFIQADISDNRASQGAGLGLSISKAYVEMLGGELRVESEKGKGSIFYFTIPYDEGIKSN